MLPILAALFAPAADLVKKYISKEEDQMKAMAELEKIQASVTTKFIELEQEKIKLQIAESGSSNWLSSSWRPLSSLAIVSIIILSSFDLAHPNQQFYELAQWFLVGYTASRSVDKVVPGILNSVLKNRK